MAKDLPELPVEIQRKHQLQWKNLIESRGFRDGRHLHPIPIPVSKIPPPPMVLGSRGSVNSTVARRPTPTSSGPRYDPRIDTTVTVTKERFSEVATDWFDYWRAHPEWDSDRFADLLKKARESVEAEVMDLWDGTEPGAKEFEPNCRLKVRESLQEQSRTWERKARDSEIARLADTSARKPTLEPQRTVAELQPAQSPQLAPTNGTGEIATSVRAKPTAWEDVELSFLSETRVQCYFSG
ncbi:MAG TPA: hypothetical protein VNV82_13115, partial [Bryobacteraceae bacterium]|nr:hypothetical protein [Bryobacteraceae bacterium]